MTPALSVTAKRSPIQFDARGEIVGKCSFTEQLDEDARGVVKIEGKEYPIQVFFNAAGKVASARIGRYQCVPGPKFVHRCSCPDWTFKRQHTDKGCKHTAALSALARVVS